VTIEIRAANGAARSDAELFYRAQLGRDVRLEADQEVLVARESDVIVAVLRLCPEAGTLLLRTVVVAADRRGQGIGRSLLVAASHAIGPRECWCFPWAYLESFYAAIGLLRVAADHVPVALLHRTNPECIATFRAARP
jgi:N-acetylglutamate synthase-like GNAT family acetyltransferase